MAANCTVVPPNTPSNAGIAGAGVLLSFILTAGVSLVISASLIVQDTWGKTARQRKANGGISQPAQTSVGTIIGRKLLNSYSDQQIFTGIGIQSLGLAQAGSLVPYHFFVIWMLGLLSSAVHNAALLALVHDFRRDWVLRWLRQWLMFVNMGLSCVYGVFVLKDLTEGMPATLPMGCVWDESAVQSDTGKTGSAGGFQYVATIAVIASNGVVFLFATWYLHNRGQRFYRIVQTIGLLLMGAVAIGVTVRVVLLSQAFGHPSVALSDDGETQWSFGQLLAMLLLLLPLISIVEIARGEIKVAPPVQDTSDSDTVPLVDNLPSHSTMRNSFQPSPFFTKRK